MGKYMRKAKTAGEVALMDLAQSSLGVRTRARTLALQRLQKSAAAVASSGSGSGGGGSYLQLRSRRLEKPPIGDSKRQRQNPRGNCGGNPNSNSRTSSRLRVGSLNSGSVSNKEAEKVGAEEEENDNVIEASFGENVLEIEGRERSTRESTPCSLIRDPESIRTPGSTTRPTCTNESNRRAQSSVLRHIPTAHDMDDFFASAEEQQQKKFIEKYNFDPVNDEPLPGRFEWAKVDP